MDTYSIETDSYGAYEIRVTKPDGTSNVIPGFPTWSDAQGWVNEQSQIAMRTANALDVP